MPKIDWRWFDSPTHVALFLGGLAITATSVIVYLVFVPAETRADVQAWLGPLLIALASGGGATSVATLLAGRASSRGPTRISSAPPSNPRGGFAAIDSMGAVLLVVAGACALSLLLHGCGAAASDQQRRDYAIEAAHCMEAEQAIADRPPTTEQVDLDALAAEEARCDAARRAIEHPAVDGGL